ncbi:LysR family transcriptional regulator [Bombilactobacillus thymidiniphilus]|uniref:LysR family transcriptional regulator n=1 Tax=Bombilactobacillus thymidiniphilus TaxID=2923363 RepID=A0ABY4PDE1_9LACO|nr:LysR family transcriptional regulator [Bombilactobacillus thymidiniphilus]UQS83693.1 LysR family transcriptional regulator [Bombilactobacillus thymidiniphilus]
MTVGKDNFTHVFTSKSLSYFAKLAENLNYTKTARSLGITQPALTQQIKKIERNIGTPLFYSVGKQIHLTDAGRILLQSVGEMYTTMYTAIDKIQKSTLSSTGAIKIGMLSTIEDSVFEEFIIWYNNLQPDVVVELMLLTRRELWDELENNQLDLAIMYLPDSSIKNWKPYRTKSIYHEQLILLHNNSEWENADTITLEDAASKPWVSYPSNYYLTELLNEQFKNKLVNPPRSLALFASPHQILRFAREKKACAVLPESFVRANRSKISLHKTYIEPQFDFELDFVYRKEKANIPRIATFLNAWDQFVHDKSYQQRLKDSVMR